MKKRSEVKRSAAERTIPLFEEGSKVDVKSITVTCDACDAVSRAEKLTRRADGDYECPECGAPVEVGKATKKALAAEKDSTPSSGFVEKSKKRKEEPEEDDEEEDKPQKKISKASSGTFCAECGAQWAMVNDEIWPNCGHKNKGVDDPSKAKRIHPPAGHQWPTVKKVTYTQPEAMYRIADFCTFRTPTITLEAEVGDKENYLEVLKRLRDEAIRTQNDAFTEIHASYMAKLEFIKADIERR